MKKHLEGVFHGLLVLAIASYIAIVFVLVVWATTGDLWEGIAVGINYVISIVATTVIGILTMAVKILIPTIKKLKDYTSKFDSLNRRIINALWNIATQNCANIQETMKICRDLKHAAK